MTHPTTDLSAVDAFNFIHVGLGEDSDIAITLIAKAAEDGVAAWKGDEHQPVKFTIARGKLDGETVFTITTA